jgi:HEAT repeat protein
MESAEINHERVLQTLYEVLDRDNALSRCCAVKALERVDGREGESAKRLIELLMDPDPDVRTDAVVSLGRMRISEATEALLHSLENDPDGEVRVEAVKALSGIGSRAAVEPLIRCLQADGYPELEDGDMADDMPYAACWEVHGQTLDALGKLGDGRATDSVIALLENDEYADLQERGFRVLAEISNDRAREFLLARLESDDPLARRRAARALAALSRREADSQDLSSEVVNRLTTALMDSDPGVRINAARALAGSSNPLVIVPLTMLLADPETEVRREVAVVLGRMRGGKIIDRLHGLLADPDPRVRREVAQALGEIGDPASSVWLTPLLDSEDGDLLHHVIGAIGKIGVTGSETRIAEILANEEAHFTVRVQAANALGRLLRAGPSTQQDEDGAPLCPKTILARAVFDPRDAVCQAALKALVDIDADNAVATLSKYLGGAPATKGVSSHAEGASDGERDHVEGEIPQEIERLVVGHDATTSTLAAMMIPVAEEASAVAEPPREDGQAAPSNSVRILAARLLGGLPAPGAQAVRDLMDAYRQGNAGLRREIIVALGRIGDQQALPVVVEGLAAEEPEIRSAALDALEGFPGVSAADEHLLELLADEDPHIRERAVQTIGVMQSPAALGALPRMLGDSDRAVCRAALRALPGNTKSEELCTRVFELMFKFSAELVVDAAAALRRMDDRGSASRLVAMLDDPKQEEFHWICIDALAEMFARAPGISEGTS